MSKTIFGNDDISQLLPIAYSQSKNGAAHVSRTDFLTRGNWNGIKYSNRNNRPNVKRNALQSIFWLVSICGRQMTLRDTIDSIWIRGNNFLAKRCIDALTLPSPRELIRMSLRQLASIFPAPDFMRMSWPAFISNERVGDSNLHGEHRKTINPHWTPGNYLEIDVL